MKSEQTPPPVPPSLASLRRATAVALVCVPLLVVTVVLPAEKGIDPTGIGRILGLTEMGLAKKALLEEEATVLEMGAWKRAQGRLDAMLAGLDPSLAAALSDSARAALESPVGEQHVLIEPGEEGELWLDVQPGSTVAYAWATDAVALPWRAEDLPASAGGREAESTGNGAQDLGILTPATPARITWRWSNETDAPVTVVLRATP